MPYPEDFRKKLIELVRAGRSSRDVAKEFGANARTVRYWVALAEAASLTKEQLGQKKLRAGRIMLSKVLERHAEGLPEHVKILGLFDEPHRTLVRIHCRIHGEKKVTNGYLSRSPYGCPDCGLENIGYAGYRLRSLIERGERGRNTWLGVMEVEVFGIRALKVGVSTRRLSTRYRHFLKEMFFSARLQEVDALLLENEIHRTFRHHVDLRIMKAGMREGKRWAGDTECYWFNQKEAILELIQCRLADLERGTPDYWAEFHQFEQPDFHVKRKGREPGIFNPPRPVVCLDTGERFSSASAGATAKGTTQANLCSAIKGRRRLAGGHRWAWAEDFDAGNITAVRPSRRGKPRPVICVETGEEFESSVAAGRAKQCSASHITSACRGNRHTAGGFHWKYR